MRIYRVDTQGSFEPEIGEEFICEIGLNRLHLIAEEDERGTDCECCPLAVLCKPEIGLKCHYMTRSDNKNIKLKLIF